MATGIDLHGYTLPPGAGDNGLRIDAIGIRSTARPSSRRESKRSRHSRRYPTDRRRSGRMAESRPRNALCFAVVCSSGDET